MTEFDRMSWLGSNFKLLQGRPHNLNGFHLNNCDKRSAAWQKKAGVRQVEEWMKDHS